MKFFLLFFSFYFLFVSSFSIQNEKKILLNFFSKYDNTSLFLPEWTSQKTDHRKLTTMNYHQLFEESENLAIQRYLSGRKLLENLIQYDLEKENILRNEISLEKKNEALEKNFRLLSENLNNHEPHKQSKKLETFPKVSNPIKYEDYRNDRVAMVVTSTIVKTHMMWERIIPGSRTWMKGFKNVFVIIEDTFLSRYSLRHCQIEEYSRNTIFKCPNEPIYVLTRNCTSDYYGGKGPCCKFDDLLSFITNDYQNGEFLNTIDYIFHGDDDSYFRPDQIFRFLNMVNSSGISHFPLVGNASPTNTKGSGIWHVNGCTDIMSTGWYQPIMLNKAALLLMKNSFKSFGLRDVCTNFIVTHDVGLEVFVWLFGLHHIQLPSTQINPSHKGFEILKPTQMIVHNLRYDNKDKCRGDDLKEWTTDLKYKQNVVIGCGDIDQDIQFHDKIFLSNFYDAYNFFLEFGTDVQFKLTEYSAIVSETKEKVNGEDIVKIKVEEYFQTKQEGDKYKTVLLPPIAQISGYSNTTHAKQYDITKEWQSFKPSDCLVPGTIGR